MARTYIYVLKTDAKLDVDTKVTSKVIESEQVKTIVFDSDEEAAKFDSSLPGSSEGWLQIYAGGGDEIKVPEEVTEEAVKESDKVIAESK